jgi:hypothetical protein
VCSITSDDVSNWRKEEKELKSSSRKRVCMYPAQRADEEDQQLVVSMEERGHGDVAHPLVQQLRLLRSHTRMKISLLVTTTPMLPERMMTRVSEYLGHVDGVNVAPRHVVPEHLAVHEPHHILAHVFL